MFFFLIQRDRTMAQIAPVAIISQDVQKTADQILSQLDALEIKGPGDSTIFAKPFTDIEAQQLVAVQDDKGQPLFDMANKENFYQLVMLAVELRKINDFDIIYAYFKKGWFARDLQFLSPFMFGSRLRVTIEESDILQKPVTEEGIYTCVNAQCREKKILRRQVQIRGADEPATTFLTCLSCGQKWRKG